MSANRYKLRCGEPDVFGRSALDETLRALSQCSIPHSRLVDLIRSILAGPAIAKPERHLDGNSGKSDAFSVSQLSKADAYLIADIFFDLEASEVTDDGEASLACSHYVGLADAWRRYAEA